MEIIQPANLVLTLIIAYWAGTNVVFTGVKAANEARDKIIAGKIGEKTLAYKELSSIFWFDWLPIVIALASISSVLGIVLMALPEFISSKHAVLAGERAEFKNIARVCYIAAIVPWCGAAWFLFRTVSEYRVLRPWTREQKAK